MGAKIITGQDDAVMMIILKYYEPLPFMLFNSGVHNAGPSRRHKDGLLVRPPTRAHKIRILYYYYYSDGETLS